MLNELFELAASQQNTGITNRDSWHGSYKPCPKGATTVRLLLNRDGGVSNFELIRDIAHIEAIRKYEPANGQSFPAFNIKPLYWADSDDVRLKIKAVKKQIETGQSVDPSIAEILGACSVLWGNTDKKNLGKCCRLAGEFSAIIGEPAQDMFAVSVLAKRVAQLTPDGLFAGIKDVAVRKITQGEKTIMDWLDKLFLCTIQDKAKAKKVSIVCDLSDRSAYAYPPTHDKVQRWVNSQLMQSNATSPDGSDSDAFGGIVKGTDVKFPPATLPRLGKVILRAMNSESPCQNRYGRADAASFCVGADTRQSMKDSLEWLGKEERKNLTWRDVSGVCGYTKRDGKSVPVPGVLFAYPSIVSNAPPPVPAMFAGEEDAMDSDGSRFAAMAKRVVDGLSGILKERPDAEIRVFVLTKADKARTKLLLSRHYVASRISAAAAEWEAGCMNVPRISLNIGTGKKEKANWIIPFTPFPTEVVGCLNVVWYREGDRAEQVSGLSIGEGLSLLLEVLPYINQVAIHLLNVALKNTCTLLLALGHADHRNDGSFTWNKNTKPRAKHASLLPCILGLLLYKVGHRKGDYMHTAPFLVGQMMSLADTLHKEYCLKVRGTRKGNDASGRKGNGEPASSGLPRQLIGNAAMSIAMDNPTDGLARLTERILIYQAWANTASGDIGYAGWALGEYRRIADELEKVALPDRSTDADKAQMLLGYLSRIGERKDDNGKTAKTESEE
jgi:hypothetical protein